MSCQVSRPSYLVVSTLSPESVSTIAPTSGRFRRATWALPSIAVLCVLVPLAAALQSPFIARRPLTHLFSAEHELEHEHKHEHDERGAAITASTPFPISLDDKSALHLLQGGLLLCLSSLPSFASSASFAATTPTATTATPTTTASSSATSSLAAATAATAAATAATAAAETITIPMTLFDNCFCCNYTINGGASSYRAIIDTGSPFLIVPSICTSEWGCVVDVDTSKSGEYHNGDDGKYRARAAAVYEQVSSLAPTIEIFGGQDYEAEWKQGDLSFVEASLHGVARNGGGGGVEAPRAAAAASRATSTAAAKGRNLFSRVIFASVGEDVRRAPGGVFIGLIKYKQKRIRPTLMSQLAFNGFCFDPNSKLLTLSRQRPFITPRSDCVPIVDLSALGDPVSHYAAKVFKLEVNGIEIAAEKTPAGLYAIFDTGTTGCTISDDLMNDSDTPIPVRKVRVFLKTEQDAIVIVEAEATRDEPFVVTASKIPWFSYTYTNTTSLQRDLERERERESDDEQLEREEEEQKQRLRQAPQIIVLGLTFLRSSVLTVDIEANRLQIIDKKSRPPPRHSSPPPRAKKH